MNEIDKLRKMLEDANIPFESYIDKREDIAKYLGARKEVDKYMRNQIIYGRTGEHSWKLDAIYHRGSYGRYEGLLEIWGDLIEGDPITATAEQTFEIIKNDWEGV